MGNLYTQSDVLHSYGCIDRTVSWSYDTAVVLASFLNLFCNACGIQYQIWKTLNSKKRTCIKILAKNGSYNYEIGA